LRAYILGFTHHYWPLCCKKLNFYFW
jgi:hypothetical protein